MHCVEICSLATSFIMIVRDVIMELAAWTQYLPKLKLGLCNLVSEPWDFLLRQLTQNGCARSSSSFPRAHSVGNFLPSSCIVRTY